MATPRLPDESRRRRGSRLGRSRPAPRGVAAAPTRIAPRTVPARAPRRRRDHSSDAAAPPRFKEKKRRRGSRALHHRRGVGHGVDAGLLNLLVQQALLLGDEVPVVRAGPRATSTSPRRLSADVVAAASPRLLSTEYPRRSRGVTATRLRSIRAAERCLAFASSAATDSRDSSSAAAGRLNVGDDVSGAAPATGAPASPAPATSATASGATSTSMTRPETSGRSAALGPPESSSSSPAARTHAPPRRRRRVRALRCARAQPRLRW